MFRSRMEAVDKWMNDRALPKKMRYQISKFYAEVRAFCPAPHAGHARWAADPGAK